MATFLHVVFTLLLAAQSNALALRAPTPTATPAHHHLYDVAGQPLPTAAPVGPDQALLRRDLTVTSLGSYLIAPDGIFGYYAAMNTDTCMLQVTSIAKRRHTDLES